RISDRSAATPLVADHRTTRQTTRFTVNLRDSTRRKGHQSGLSIRSIVIEYNVCACRPISEKIRINRQKRKTRYRIKGRGRRREHLRLARRPPRDAAAGVRRVQHEVRQWLSDV